MAESNTHDAQASTQNPSFDVSLLDILACPLTKTPLIYDAQAQELISKAAQLAYPIHHGIPILIKEEARVIES
jgi:uncharacterized protein